MAEYWSAKQGGGYIKCPVKNCNHIGNIITEAHCRMEHGMTREEIRKEYGLPHNVSIRKSKANSKK
ncbi:hypothetical protein [Lysinibacillus sp. BSL11]